MRPVRISDLFARVLDELDVARNSLSEAALWARSDWSDRRGLTDDEREAREAVFAAVRQAKDAIDHIKSLVDWAERNRVDGRGR